MMLETSDEHYMRQALKEAEQAFKADEVPVGVIVVCNDRIIARGHNLAERLNDVTAHAEMQSITAAAEHIGGKYLKDCTLAGVSPIMRASLFHFPDRDDTKAEVRRCRCPQRERS